MRYSVPTAGVMWVTIEITQEWGLYEEFWTQPQEYALEMGLVLAAFVIAMLLAVVMPRRRTVKRTDPAS